MRSNRQLLVLLPLLLGVGCSSCEERDRRRQEQAANMQRIADSVATAMQQQTELEQRAIKEADTAQTSTALTLDSGIWHEAGSEWITPVPKEELTFADWQNVSDDTIALEQRTFDEAALQDYLQDPDLDYDRVIHHEHLWWDRLMRWLGRMLEKLFGTRGGRAVFNNLHWVLLGTAVLVVAWYFRSYLLSAVFGSAPIRARQVTEVEEDITELDIDGALLEAEQRKDWRMAFRYQWLKVLRKLVDSGHITWQPRSTDADYLAQLKDPALRAQFSELSFLFKWVWYGDAPMDAERYKALKPTFEAMHSQRMHVERTPSPATPVAAP
jgi:Domain of unknown function (DUF4129)